MGDEVLFEMVEEGIARVILNRPEKLNAINAAMRAGIVTAFDEVDASDEARVVILKGAGDRAFCVGGDIEERRQMDLADMRRLRHSWLNPYSRIESCRKPVVAVISGYCLGGGLELALAADFRFASDSAQFGMPEVKLGVIPAGGGTQRLPRIVGISNAKRLIYMGATITAQEAYRIGLVDEVCLLAELDRAALEFARLIAKNPALAVSEAKRAINLGFEMASTRGLALEAECYLTCMTSPERKEALQAFATRNARRQVVSGSGKEND